MRTIFFKFYKDESPVHTPINIDRFDSEILIKDQKTFLELHNQHTVSTRYGSLLLKNDVY